MTVVNLFAEMATSPTALSTSSAPVGECNDRTIAEGASLSKMVMAAWGNHGTMENPATGVARCEEVLELLAAGPMTLSCLGMTSQGQPRHPLYVPAATRPSPFRPDRELVAQMNDFL